jgi:hypothetical protein
MMSDDPTSEEILESLKSFLGQAHEFLSKRIEVENQISDGDDDFELILNKHDATNLLEGLRRSFVIAESIEPAGPLKDS